MRQYDRSRYLTRYNFNGKLFPSVKIVKKLALDSDLFFCDLSCEEPILKKLREANKKILISVHGMLNSQFGLSKEQKLKAIQYADIVQFVSPIQQNDYQIEADSFVVIPNIVESVMVK
jgi:hypothetical protein